MDLWYPPPHEPHLFEWWAPLLTASRQARRVRCAWPIHLDEFQLMGRVDRPSRPAIWIYKHVESRRELHLDAEGRPYTFTPTPNAKGSGRFNRCDIRTAIWRADLPAFVQPVFYDEPPQRADEASWDRHDERPAANAPRDSPPRRRGHLTLIEGGSSLAG